MHGNALAAEVSQIGQLTLMTVHGDIDMDSAHFLRVVLDQLEPGAHASIDMSDVGFMDSSGLNVLTVYAIRLRDGDGWLRIRNPSPGVRRVVEITSLGAFLFEGEVVPDVTQSGLPPV
jgi:anti-sigma B factor antagonist